MKPPSLPRRMWFVAVPCLVLVASGCKRAVPVTVTPAEPPAAVQTVHLVRGSITRNVTLPGEIKAYQEATLYAKVPGYLKTITVDKGDRVRAGDLLAELEVPELLADRARYRAEVEVARIDYQRLEESQRKAPDLVVPQTVDDARGRWEIAKAQLERTDTLLAYARILAPFDGVITKRLVDPGAFVPAATSGSAAQNAALVALMDFNTVRIQVAVPELESSLIATNQTVVVTTDALPGRRFAGGVTRFAYALDEATKTMLAEIELSNPKLELRPGMFAYITIGLENRTNSWLLPTSAVLRDKAGAAVFVVVDHKAKRLPVQTGFNDGTNVEVRDGLTPEAAVVRIDKRMVADGQRVEVMEAK